MRRGDNQVGERCAARQKRRRELFLVVYPLVLLGAMLSLVFVLLGVTLAWVALWWSVS